MGISKQPPHTYLNSLQNPQNTQHLTLFDLNPMIIKAMQENNTSQHLTTPHEDLTQEGKK